MLLGLTISGQMKLKNHKQKAHDCFSFLFFVHSEPYSPQKQRSVSKGEVTPVWMTASSSGAHYMSCQGGTLCPQLLPQITPEKLSFIWPLITIISPNLPQSTLWKSICPKKPYMSFLLLFLPKKREFYSRVTAAEYWTGLHKGDVLYTYGWMSERSAISKSAALLKVVAWRRSSGEQIHWSYSSLRLVAAEPLLPELEVGVLCKFVSVKSHTSRQ